MRALGEHLAAASGAPEPTAPALLAAAGARAEARRGGAEAGGAPAIAIVGMAGRFPGAASADELWRNLCGGVESISFLTDEELPPPACRPASSPTRATSGRAA